MATNPQISYAAANAEADAWAALLNSGTWRFYAGTVPTRADDSIGAATLLVQGNFAASAFGAASNGAVTKAATAQATISNTGAATFARFYKSDGTTCVWQGLVGASGCDINLDNVNLQSGTAFDFDAFTHTVVRGA